MCGTVIVCINIKADDIRHINVHYYTHVISFKFAHKFCKVVEDLRTQCVNTLRYSHNKEDMSHLRGG